MGLNVGAKYVLNMFVKIDTRASDDCLGAKVSRDTGRWVKYVEPVDGSIHKFDDHTSRHFVKWDGVVDAAVAAMVYVGYVCR